jgi:4-hydroxythreonine-4-phosphate dehydrogenase
MSRIFITSGDVNGIGNELILKFFHSLSGLTEDAYIIIGNRRIFDETAGLLKLSTNGIQTISEEQIEGINSGFYFLDIPAPGLKLDVGHAEKEAGKLSGEAIKTGVGLAVKYGGALVTCPINKYSLHLGGFNYPGHTEFIAELLKTDDFLMVLDGGKIKVALVTTHLAIKDVPAALNIPSIIKKGSLLYNSLKQDYGINCPRISVCSLNPHAGDSGLFGDEENKIINPAVDKLNGMISDGHFTGPLPSDTLFTENFLAKTDAYLVMYHDQGLIPLKLLSFGSAVNFTAGLIIVRTSPDHGTAYDIAGKGIADFRSFKNAVEKAKFFLINRRSILPEL